MRETDKLILVIVLLLSIAMTAFVWYMVHDMSRLDYELTHEPYVSAITNLDEYLIRPGRKDSLHYERNKCLRIRDK